MLLVKISMCRHASGSFSEIGCSVVVWKTVGASKSEECVIDSVWRGRNDKCIRLVPRRSTIMVGCYVITCVVRLRM